MVKCFTMSVQIKGKTIVNNVQVRQLIISLRNYFEKERLNGGPLKSVSKVNDRTSDALNVHASTISRVTKESCNGHVFRTPQLKRKQRKPVTDVDTLRKEAIRDHIYSYYEKKVLPTLPKLILSLEESQIFTAPRNSLHRVIRNIGFKLKKYDTYFFVEHSHIVKKRHEFLKYMKDADYLKVIFIDKIMIPLSKSERLVICYAGSKAGFVPNTLLTLIIKYTGDCEVTILQIYRKWFQNQLMCNIPPESIIITDEALNHSVQLNKEPTLLSTKKDIMNWLTKNNIPYDKNCRKPDLFKLVRQAKFLIREKYHLDEIAWSKGHRVVRLPPLHCIQYNALQCLWSQVKQYMVESKEAQPYNSSQLIHLFTESITGETWSEMVAQTENIINEHWQRDERIENFLEKVISNPADDSSSDSDESMHSESDNGEI